MATVANEEIRPNQAVPWSRWRPSLLLAGFLALTLIWAPSQVYAWFIDTGSVGANSFSTASCLQPALSSVRKGTLTNNANGVQTVPITAVDPSRSFLMMSTSSGSSRAVGSVIRGRIASPTILEFARVTNELIPSAIGVSWSVVEYSCGVSVQRGELVRSTPSASASITPVGSTGRAFLTWSMTVNPATTGWSSAVQTRGTLVDTSTIQFDSGGNPATDGSGPHTIWWQVVEFTTTASITVQRGTAALTGTSLSTTVTLPTPVTLSRAFVLADFRTTGSGLDIGARMLAAQITGTTTVELDRQLSGSPDDIDQISWQVIEVKDGSRVQTGVGAFSLLAGSVTANITAVTLNQATVFGSVQIGAGQAAGQTNDTLSTVVGVASARMSFNSSTQISLVRGNTLASANIVWQVVEWDLT